MTVLFRKTQQTKHGLTHENDDDDRHVYTFGEYLMTMVNHKVLLLLFGL
jgi:hypothetical protein